MVLVSSSSSNRDGSLDSSNSATVERVLEPTKNKYHGLVVVRDAHSERSRLDGLFLSPPSKEKCVDDPQERQQQQNEEQRRKQRIKRSILKKPQTADTNYVFGFQIHHQRQHQHVRFANVYIREYARTVGDHPCCSDGPPISISWEYTETQVMTLDAYECHRLPLRAMQIRDTILLRNEREYLLLRVWGVSRSDVAQAVREVIKTKNSRRNNLHKQSSRSAAGKVERTLDKIRSSLTTTITRSKTSSDLKALELQAQQDQATQAQNKKEQQQLPQPQNPPRLRRSVTTRLTFGDEERKDEEGVGLTEETQSTPKRWEKPVEFEELVKTIKAGHNTPLSPLKGIVRKAQVPHQNNNKNNRNKTVSFATNHRTNQIWCLVEEFANPDDDLFECLWWSEDEMEDRYRQDCDIVDSVHAQYGKILVAAYESTKYCGSDAGKVALEYNQMSDCASARGLEKAVIPSLRDCLIQTHAQAVIHRQRQVGQGKKSGNGGDNEDVNDWEAIRRGSQKFSRASRLIALKMAAFDKKQAAAAAATITTTA